MITLKCDECDAAITADKASDVVPKAEGWFAVIFINLRADVENAMRHGCTLDHALLVARLLIEGGSISVTIQRAFAERFDTPPRNL